MIHNNIKITVKSSNENEVAKKPVLCGGHHITRHCIKGSQHEEGWESLVYRDTGGRTAYHATVHDSKGSKKRG